MISVYFQGKPFNITVIQVYGQTTDAKEVKIDWCLEYIQHLLEHQKEDVLFIIGDWNAKVGSQETLEVTGKFGLRTQNKAGPRLTRILSREHTGHSKNHCPINQETTLHMDIIRWSTPKANWLFS